MTELNDRITNIRTHFYQTMYQFRTFEYLLIEKQKNRKITKKMGKNF